MMIENREIHFSPGPLDATPEQIEAANATGEFWVFNSPIPCTRHLIFNLNHPVLSNRYVRQAIAHAIDYTHIVDDLPLAALNGHLQATPVWRSLEWAYPTPADEVTYNLEPYEYNITIANEYMDMYMYSLVGTDWTQQYPDERPKSPLGDGDFSGYVEPLDFTIWANRIVEGQLIPDQWPWRPGRDIDPDFDNNEYVELNDYYIFRDLSEDYYPFYGAR